jgi:hypothetical protein
LPVTATQLLEYLQQHPACSIEKREIHSTSFGNLRKGIRRIVTRLSEGDEADSQEVADNLRMVLSEWLTVPVCFEGMLLESVAALGEAPTVEMRWGREVRIAYDLACSAASAIQQTENPARAQIREIIGQLRLQETNWRIYCHRRARTHFETIFPDEPLAADSFLHSVKDYRESKVFDVLIKMGPLRSKGWGSAPDAVLSAPRFETLVQLVWAGCADEDDFGYDPVAARIGKEVSPSPTKDNSSVSAPSAVSWSRSVIHVGDSPSDAATDIEVDELKLFRELTRASEMRHATLVQIDDADGILYPPHSQVPTFDPALNSEDPLTYRLPDETLSEGMFVIWPILGTADMGGLHAGEGHYSRIWKERLRDKFKYTSNDLLGRLREGGIELRNLRSCVRQWCKPASTVIHAPQQRRHFETLIRVLGIDHDAATPTSHMLRRPWWEYAWSEIGHARGEAIQSGLQEHEIIDEQLFLILRDLLPDIRRGLETQDFFQIELPNDKPLRGAVRFYRVRSIEEGFLVPDTLLKVICDLDTVEQWRV